jgi:2'-5' RNA ligase
LSKPLSARVNVAIVPPPNVVRSLERVASRVHADSIDFRIGGRRTPHLTLYMAQMDVSRIPDLVELARKSLEVTSGVECHAVAYSLTANGYVEVAMQKTDALLKVQSRIIALWKAFVTSGAAPEQHLSQSERDNLDHYGYEFVGDAFRPHITVARVKPDESVLLPPLQREELAFQTTRVGIFEADSTGATSKLLSLVE